MIEQCEFTPKHITEILLRMHMLRFELRTAAMKAGKKGDTPSEIFWGEAESMLSQIQSLTRQLENKLLKGD